VTVTDHCVAAAVALQVRAARATAAVVSWMLVLVVHCGLDFV